MALPSIVGPSQRWNQRGPGLTAQRLLALPLAGLILRRPEDHGQHVDGLMVLLLVGCVGRQASTSQKKLKEGGSPAVHNLNRGRIGAHQSSDDHHD